jgi:serine/threonine protein kinase
MHRSIGCILAEMLGNKALFPGKNYVDQLSKIFEIMGTPRGDDLLCIQSERPRDYVLKLPFRPKQPLSTIFPDADQLVLDLVEKLLSFDPSRRLTAEMALAHPYFAEYHDPEDEVGACAGSLGSLICHFMQTSVIIYQYI